MPENEAIGGGAEDPGREDDQDPESTTPKPMFVEMNIVDRDDPTVDTTGNFITTTPLSPDELAFLTAAAREETLRELIRQQEETKRLLGEQTLKLRVARDVLRNAGVAMVGTIVLLAIKAITPANAEILTGATGVYVVVKHFFPRTGD